MSSNIALLILVSLLTCAGQLCQKQAVICWQKKDIPHKGISMVMWLFGAVLLLGMGMIFWLRLLQFLPLGIAYPMLSINFVVVTLMGQFIYREKVGPKHWVGILAIMFGILLMSLEQ
ncbi:EamA family transporter [Xenorhabdus nematophila]|uniref:Probable 4-amino-4-deoxy-L-arabinose-phosphoundecaprenol flippase subunit ArnE n=1 Tax=Xenorhabdus nematophila (strain ATCC 19061 / DSM 3370 / CCUG 14189 / LMG 1036 / NCIMB 9965 / AN6) TaxID=406817 RepID=D3VD34_XENNA|nr:4-amino-4-deoxy-L-arabinose-phosphoundecaprenol flippase subunit ArnE [Xenorhabdus nematophila]CEE91057.1 Inner membrane protein yfbW [Xenorhabdus nematophila str. Anatoliense]CEF33737.1 Inner membrane protein yfbW [Xenorhabdus nematophila str. Websteri]AYA40446.1 4-amino-4-deoxy-L-arabinose-phospho-UDP flippase [Xenorhabdus nematophila]KHD28511.1 4-amino-4-deoxy-L-arabinose-phospho-UDP flippase [Xenorhabdus nematophila]MBA0019178.1 EamA family transporter [Xenorhabdus nematophila]